MKSAADLERAFGLYFSEMERCEKARCYWALLHLVIALPDVCASLERPEDRVGARYVDWCRNNFPCTSELRPGDLFQIRNAVLHQGTSLPANVSGNEDHRTSYSSFSFVGLSELAARLHQNVNPDGTRGGDNLTLFVGQLAADMRGALRSWFRKVESDPLRNARLESNLARVARVQPKTSEICTFEGLVVTFTIVPHSSISST